MSERWDLREGEQCTTSLLFTLNYTIIEPFVQCFFPNPGRVRGSTQIRQAWPRPTQGTGYRVAGDHTGRAYSYWSLVMRVTLLPSAFIMYT